MLALQGGVFGVVLVGGAGQLGPVVEDFGGGGAGAALQLGFDGPGEGGAVVFGEQDVGAEGVEVFGVEEEAVHVEQTGADGGWRGHCVWLWLWCVVGEGIGGWWCVFCML